MLKQKEKFLSSAVCIMLVILCVVYTYYRNELWSDELKLWRDISLKSQHDPRVRNNFGGHLKDNGFFEEALNEFFFVIEVSPNDYEPYNNVGLIYREKKEYSRAIGYLLKAMALKPDRFEMQYNIAVVYDEIGDRGNSIFWYRKFLSIAPRSYEYQIIYAQKRIKLLLKNEGNIGEE